MFLVHEKKDKKGVWEIAWMWLPHFLAADRELQKHVDQRMGELFKGRNPEDSNLVSQMHEQLLLLLLEKHPVPGLRRLLEAYTYLRPEDQTL